jgi:hypothetical protein
LVIRRLITHYLACPEVEKDMKTKKWQIIIIIICTAATTFVVNFSPPSPLTASLFITTRAFRHFGLHRFGLFNSQ